VFGRVPVATRAAVGEATVARSSAAEPAAPTLPADARRAPAGRFLLALGGVVVAVLVAAGAGVALGGSSAGPSPTTDDEAAGETTAPTTPATTTTTATTAPPSTVPATTAAAMPAPAVVPPTTAPIAPVGPGGWYPQLESIEVSVRDRASMASYVAQLEGRSGVDLAFAGNDEYASLSPGWWAVYEPVAYPDGPSAYARAQEVGGRVGIGNVGGNLFSHDPADRNVQYP